jgi:AraC-like DNA-binding protein
VSSHRPHSRTAAARSDRSAKESVVDTWRHKDFDGIELHRGSGVSLEYPRHWHDELYLCAILDGSSHLDCVGTSFFTPRGTLVLVPSGTVHANRKLACTFRCVFMEFDALQRAVEQFVEQNVAGLHFRTALIDDARTMASFLRLHRSLEKSGSSGLESDNALLVFLHKLVARHSAARLPLPRDGNEDVAVQRSKRFLEEHYADRVSLHDLARLTGLSPYHLNRSFCRKIGIPPHAYQLQVRIARARSFLRLGRSISDTASLAGFVDQSHFTRHFKRCVGVTPGQYLR